MVSSVAKVKHSAVSLRRAEAERSAVIRSIAKEVYR